MIKRIFVTICALLLIGCSSYDSDDSYRLGEFKIRNIELYRLDDVGCAATYDNGMDILFYCDTAHITDDPVIVVSEYVMADIWVTDEDLDAKYLNVEVRDFGGNLTYSLHDHLIEFNYSRQDIGPEYQLFVILYGGAAGDYTIDTWIESYTGELTGAYSVDLIVL